MDKIRIATLNVRGLSDNHKRVSIFHLINRHKIDICLLTETHAKESAIPIIKQDWTEVTNGTSIFAPAPQDKIGAEGVAILFANNYKNTNIYNPKISVPGRSLSVEIKIAEKRHKILCIYAPNDPTNRRKFFNDIINTESSTLPTMWGGDFN